jgi:hypothetical protein
VGFLARLFRLDQVEQDPDLLELLTYEIRCDAAGRVAALVRPILPLLPPREYPRLWAAYEARTIFHLGGIQQEEAKAVLRTIEAIAAHGIAADTDYFTIGPPDHQLRRASFVATPAVTFHGVFYAYQRLDDPGRMITTYFPRHPPQHCTLHAGTALLHAAISANRADPDALQLIGRVAANLAALYREQLASRQQNRIEDLVHLPTNAYQAAVAAHA